MAPALPPCVTLPATAAVTAAQQCVTWQAQPASDEEREVLGQALLSLYQDQIRPHEPDVLRRLQENGASEHLQQNFLRLYETLPEYSVLYNEGSPVVMFKKEPELFEGWIDPNSSDDPYPEEVWQGFLGHIAVLMQTTNSGKRPECPNLGRYQFKGGRYGMAMELYRQQLSFLQHLTLGQVCHLVQLAISRGILAYERSVLQPVAAVRKAACAAVSKPVKEEVHPHPLPTPQTQTQAPLPNTKDISGLREQIKDLLDERPNGVILSRLNREFSARYNKRIDPTVYGYTKMSDFLLSEELRDVCRVSVNRRNHVIVQSTRFRVLDKFTPLPVDSKVASLPSGYWTPANAQLTWNFWTCFTPALLSDTPSSTTSTATSTSASSSSSPASLPSPPLPPSLPTHFPPSAKEADSDADEKASNSTGSTRFTHALGVSDVSGSSGRSSSSGSDSPKSITSSESGFDGLSDGHGGMVPPFGALLPRPVLSSARRMQPRCTKGGRWQQQQQQQHHRQQQGGVRVLQCQVGGSGHQTLPYPYHQQRTARQAMTTRGGRF
ncbi:unnamed protein product [Vitrella brassicaformis CCMP3155]|uniref:HTH OST-type domain-containing protein n=1 Tax=Vitrella brassicaformis (strain CCMP3155) TaxID=1169540 RepID=A0A0G4EI04_VITBC|nr:unnamed protein product [Vitrella brassicaformis CCMP3155]|mmetsp:Transcript_39338/g.98396  ORF Transcript_39338/g.98396 Transcript_39338/m.98396 type:complete len:550 (-) Transcript_39338:738-2387(-)|eukprot:CEL95613.1 unnamed protein product [Vitrella brassicaformis CCMP3155]